MKIQAYLFALLFILSPLSLSAQTESSVSDLLEQIKALTAKVAEIQAQLDLLNKGTNVAETSIFVSIPNKAVTKNLSIGMSGGEVTLLQEILSKDSEVYPEGLVTGYYGVLTENAVKRYQKKNGLEEVGAVGPLTRKKINSISKEKESVVETTTNTGGYKEVNISFVIENGKVSWKTNGELAKKGVALVWSKEENPVYPAREKDIWVYFKSGTSGSHILQAKDGPGIYYVRLCAFDEYTNECNAFSKQIKINLE